MYISVHVYGGLDGQKLNKLNIERKHCSIMGNWFPYSLWLGQSGTKLLLDELDISFHNHLALFLIRLADIDFSSNCSNLSPCFFGRSTEIHYELA